MLPNQIRGIQTVNEGDPWCQNSRKKWCQILRNSHHRTEPDPGVQSGSEPARLGGAAPRTSRQASASGCLPPATHLPAAASAESRRSVGIPRRSVTDQAAAVRSSHRSISIDSLLLPHLYWPRTRIRAETVPGFPILPPCQMEPVFCWHVLVSTPARWGGRELLNGGLSLFQGVLTPDRPFALDQGKRPSAPFRGAPQAAFVHGGCLGCVARTRTCGS
jgi:hypothetical protein